MPYDIHYIVVESTGKDWLAYLAIGVSILALVVTWWQAYLARSHNKLTVRPQLEGHSHWSNNIYRFEVRNDGLGPAIITAARVFFEDKLVEGEGSSVIQNAFKNVLGCRLEEHEFFYTPFVLPAGASIQVCKVSYSPEIQDIEEYLGKIIYLQIEYESAYKEKCTTYQSRRPPISGK